MNHWSLLFLFVALLGCAGQAPLPPKAVALNQAGVEAMSEGDLATAEARFALALEFHPRFVDALVNLGLVEMQRGNFKLARRKLDRAMSINRHIAQPHHGLGVLEEREGRWARAAQHYRDALEVDPGFSPARANLARLYFEGTHLDHAREQFLRLTEVDPDAPQGYVGLVEVLHRLGRVSEADRVLERAHRRLGDLPELRLYRARWALRHGHIAQAKRILLTLVEGGDAASRGAWAWLGLAHLIAGEVPQSIACAERALAHERDDALGTYVLAMALSRRGDRDARLWLQRAKRLAPGNSVITEELRRVGGGPPTR